MFLLQEGVQSFIQTAGRAKASSPWMVQTARSAGG
jgi:hypothetical protein